MLTNFANAPLALQVAFVLYFLSAAAYFLSLFIRAGWLNKLALGLLAAGLVANTVFEVMRWAEAGRAPMRSRFEAVVLFSWSVALLSLASELVHRIRFVGLLGSVATVFFLLLAFGWYEPLIGNLPPALQSWWFFPHVLVYFFGYGAAAVSFFTALLVLFLPDGKRLLRLNLVTSEQVDLDRITYRLIAFAFLMLTLGMIMGALWANDAWGTYWGWDPKENWALITFLVYGLYLHLRLMRGWRGKRAAWMAVLGFAAVIITFLGVNMLPTAGQSVHVYMD